MWTLQKVGFTASATQPPQPGRSCTFTKLVLPCARICVIHSLVAELPTDYFAVQRIPTVATNCSPLSIDVHLHTPLSLSGPTSQPNSNWMGESAQEWVVWTGRCDGAHTGLWDGAKEPTIHLSPCTGNILVHLHMHMYIHSQSTQETSAHTHTHTHTPQHILAGLEFGELEFVN